MMSCDLTTKTNPWITAVVQEADGIFLHQQHLHLYQCLFQHLALQCPYWSTEWLFGKSKRSACRCCLSKVQWYIEIGPSIPSGIFCMVGPLKGCIQDHATLNLKYVPYWLLGLFHWTTPGDTRDPCAITDHQYTPSIISKSSQTWFS